MDINSIFELILNNFNFGLILSINALVYGLIKLCDLFKPKVTPKIIKIAITICSSVLLGILYWKLADLSLEVILNSCICATLIWDWILKPILKRIKIDYNNEHN